jgi:hypothetical protein
MTTYAAIGTTDENTTCDCCGKSNLKMTVVLRDDEGEFYFFGRSCAARATGWKAANLDRQVIAANSKRTEAAARVERFTAYLASTDALQVFMDSNRVAFERHHGGMTRQTAVAWLTEQVAQATAEASIPQRVAA